MEKTPSLTHVIWITPERTPYHDFFFADLALKVSRLDVIITGCAVHPWKGVTQPDYNLFSCTTSFGFWRLFFSLFISHANRALFVVSGWNRAQYICTMLLLALGRRPFIFWTDTPNVGRSRSFVLRAFRLIVTRSVFYLAERTMSTGTPGKNALIDMGCPPDRAIVFPFFVPVPDSRVERGIQARKIFFSAGRLDNALKGFDISMHAYAKVCRTAEGQNLEYRIAGDGVDRKKLFALAGELGIKSTVSFLGWLSSEEMRNELNCATAFIHPARCDPFPVVVLEAMAAGCVVLGSDVCGSVMDRVKHGKNGMIHAVGDVDTLSFQMKMLNQNTQYAEEMGQEAYKTACSWKVFVGANIVLRECMITCYINDSSVI